MGNRGQISIMGGVMVLTLLLFFAFVVNTGMLVNAKINLQNAADVAAYAGAAVQARQLNLISHLNYDMRRQYKKFLFRYYVMGNLAQDSMYDGATGPRKWYPNRTDPTVDYNVPAVCIIFNNKDNFCRLSRLGHIQIPPPSPLDAINETLRSQLQSLEKIRAGNCLRIAATNKFVLGMWLWNTDPGFQSYEATLNQDEQSILTIVRSLASGLGLIPREMLLRRRIETLAYYLNFKPRQGVTKAMVDGMGGEGDLAARERIIQAFNSAYDTLGSHTFEDGNITMDEIMNSTQAFFQPITTNFDAYYVDFKANAVNAGDNPADCVAQPVAFKVQANVPMGFKKDPRYLTYYAIRLKATAKVLLSPFGDMSLTAYAAAQPFGSRIGPTTITQADFVRNVRNSQYCGDLTTDRCFGYIPNLAVGVQDSSQSGWNQNEVLNAMFGQFRNPGTQTGIEFIDQAAMERAFLGAMVPNPWEAGKYNIINDLVADGFFTNFGTGHYRSVWAPILSNDELAQGKSADDLLLQAIDSLTAPASATQGGLNIFGDQFKQNLKRGINNYLSQLRSGSGYDDAGAGEGFHIARLVDPYSSRPVNGVAQPLRFSSDIELIDPAKVKSSWNYIKDGALQQGGRTGYSVKFVSFRMLMNPSGITSNGADPWTNPPDAPDADTQQDLVRISH